MTLRVADVAMWVLREAIFDMVEGVEDDYLDLLQKMVDGPASLRLEQDDAGTLMAVYEAGGEPIYRMPVLELLQRPITIRQKFNEPQPA